MSQVDECRAAAVELRHQWRRVVQQGQHRLRYVAVHGLGERLPEGLVLLRQQVEAVALGLGDRGGEEVEAIVQRAEMGDPLPPELLPHQVRRPEDAPVLLAAEPPAVGQQGRGDVAHHHPPGVAVALGGDDRVVDRVGHPAEHAGGEQQRLAAIVFRVAVDPIRAGHDPLGDQTPAVGEHEALEQVSGPPGRDHRLVLRDLAEPETSRVSSRTPWSSRAPPAGVRGGAV